MLSVKFEIIYMDILYVSIVVILLVVGVVLAVLYVKQKQQVANVSEEKECSYGKVHPHSNYIQDKRCQ